MTTRVLDASALLAFQRGEEGAGVVEPLLEDAAVSAVNWTEVLVRLRRDRVPDAGLRAEMEALGVRIHPFQVRDAEGSADLWSATRSKGLSLADRACLALAERLGAPVYTADRAWEDLEIGLQIHIVR